MPDQPASDGDSTPVDEMSEAIANIAERSQRLVNNFLTQQSSQFGMADPMNIGNAFLELTARMMTNPAKMMEAQMALWQGYMDLWQETGKRLMGQPSAPIAAPAIMPNGPPAIAPMVAPRPTPMFSSFDDFSAKAGAAESVAINPATTIFLIISISSGCNWPLSGHRRNQLHSEIARPEGQENVRPRINCDELWLQVRPTDVRFPPESNRWTTKLVGGRL